MTVTVIVAGVEQPLLKLITAAPPPKPVTTPEALTRATVVSELYQTPDDVSDIVVEPPRQTLVDPVIGPADVFTETGKTAYPQLLV
jgi:hypothetical protein